MTQHKPRVLFLSHGGGPLPLLGDPAHAEMVELLGTLAKRLERPSAILVISAHWEAQVPTLTSGAKPALIYDYYGFPEESYAIEYTCPGEPDLAAKVQRVLGSAGFAARLDAARGLDHGVFVPLKIMYPQADIPCVQLSLLEGLDASAHIRLGNALAGIAHDGLLIIGSGFSFHNMKAFFTPETAHTKAMNTAFERWLLDTLGDAGMAEAERVRRLETWQQAPFARYCHPREEHLLPLHVCYGTAQTACIGHFELAILNKKSSMYLW